MDRDAETLSLEKATTLLAARSTASSPANGLYALPAEACRVIADDEPNDSALGHELEWRAEDTLRTERGRHHLFHCVVGE